MDPQVVWGLVLQVLAPAPPGLQALPGLRGQQAQRVPQVSQAQQVLQAQPALQAQQVPQGLLGLLAPVPRGQQG